MENRRPERESTLGGDRIDMRRALVHHNLSTAELYEVSLAKGEGILADTGGLVVDTGVFTGRSPKDKHVVRSPVTETVVDWGSVNQPMSQAHFDVLLADMQAHLTGLEVQVQDLIAGAHPEHRRRVRVVTELAWQALFARNLFITEGVDAAEPDWMVIDLPSFKADPVRHGCRSSTVIAVDFGKRLVLIGDTEYGGEIKKSIFSALNFELPLKGILPMHCSANEDEDGRVALYFGLSGTGKTTLSSDAQRRLIGDDEHGWGDDGVFNFEGGCYAKVSNLSQSAEPEIFAATNRFGTLLENVAVEPGTRRFDFADLTKTENTRSAYSIEFIPNASKTGVGGHPENILFLCADAFGVLPPIARLSNEQAMYYFLSGYTAKVAGTERGVTEPAATFSACFGSPFMPLPAVRYAELLGERLRRHGSKVWLVNTGWTGGGPGVGSRMRLADTRALVRAALNGDLDRIETRTDKYFGLAMPVSAPGVSAKVLDPSAAWTDPGAFDATARRLVVMFQENFKAFAAQASPEVLAAGPRLSAQS